MKKLLLAIICVAELSCSKPEKRDKSTTAPLITEKSTPTSLMSPEKIDSLGNHFSCFWAIKSFTRPDTPPPYNIFGNKMVSEASEYLETLKYLDSLPLVADHLFFYGYHHFNLLPDGTYYLEESRKKTQDSLYQVIKQRKFLVATEVSAIQDLIHWNDRFEEQRKTNLLFKEMGLLKEMPSNTAMEKDLLSIPDVSMDLIRENYPVIGTEPNMIWTAEQYMLAIGPRYENQLTILSQARSEYAIASTVRWIRKNNYTNDVLILYGELHMSEFEKICTVFKSPFQILSL